MKHHLYQHQSYVIHCISNLETYFICTSDYDDSLAMQAIFCLSYDQGANTLSRIGKPATHQNDEIYRIRDTFFKKPMNFPLGSDTFFIIIMKLNARFISPFGIKEKIKIISNLKKYKKK